MIIGPRGRKVSTAFILFISHFSTNLLRCLSSMLSWSVPRGWRIDNPCDHVKKLKGSEPYEPWPWEAIELLREAAPPELWWVAALALYTDCGFRELPTGLCVMGRAL